MNLLNKTLYNYKNMKNKKSDISIGFDAVPNNSYDFTGDFGKLITGNGKGIKKSKTKCNNDDFF